MFHSLFHYSFDVFIFLFVQFYLIVDYSPIFTVFEIAHFFTEYLYLPNECFMQKLTKRDDLKINVAKEIYYCERPHYTSLTEQIIVFPIFTSCLYNIPGQCFNIFILYLWLLISVLKVVHSRHTLTLPWAYVEGIVTSFFKTKISMT